MFSPKIAWYSVIWTTVVCSEPLGAAHIAPTDTKGGFTSPVGSRDTSADSVCSDFSGSWEEFWKNAEIRLRKKLLSSQLHVLVVVPRSLLTTEDAAEERRHRPSPCRNQAMSV